MGALEGLRRMLPQGDRPRDEPLPVMMHEVEWAQILAIFEAVGPKRVLEWGSGGSTRALLEAMPGIERYDSIEHDPRWYARVSELVVDPRLHLHLVEGAEPQPDPPPKDRRRGEIIGAWFLACERDPRIFADYVAHARELGGEFDLVFVDGRARVFCMRAGWDLLRPGGVMVIHDAQREEYHATIAELGRARFLEPWHQGQVCLLRKPE